MGNEDLSGKSFYKINFTNCDLSGCDLVNNASMIGADFTKAKILLTTFDNTNLSFANFMQADLKISSFVYVNLTNAVFDDTLVRTTLFRNSDVSGVDFKLTMLSGYSLGSLTEANNLDLTSRIEAITARGRYGIIPSGE